MTVARISVSEEVKKNIEYSSPNIYLGSYQM